MAEASDIPRLDAIEGWPLPEEQTAWYGGEAPERHLIEAFAGGRMHHAWLFGGPRGVGKATLAYRFARFALSQRSQAAGEATSLAVPADDPAARKIAARAHPNVLVLSRPWDDKEKRYRTELTVPEVRRTVSFFGSTAGEAGWRICIVDAADDMNTNAANALLKILEEPPPRSLFLVLSHAPGRLLPTIRSRCRRLDLAPLPAATVEAALREHDPDHAPEDIRFAAEAGQGSLRRAIQFLDEDMIAIGRAFQRLVARLPEQDVGAMHALADLVARRGADDAFEAFLQLLGDWLSRRVRGEAEPDGSPVSPAVAAAPLVTWAEVWEKLQRSSAEAEALNLDRKQLVLTILMTLARATRM